MYNGMHKKNRMIQLVYFILMLVSCLATVEPAGLKKYNIHSVFGTLLYIAFAVGIFCCMLGRLYQNVQLWCIIAFLLSLTVSSYVYQNTINSTLKYTVICIYSAVSITLFYIKKGMAKYVTGVWAGILSTWILLDGLFVFLGVEIGTSGYWLGTKTTVTYYFLPAFTISVLFLYLSEERMERKLGYFCMFENIMGAVLYLSIRMISAYFVSVVLEAIVLWMCLKRKGKLSGFITKYGFCITSFFSIVLILFGVSDFLGTLIENILHETPDLDGRLPIWDMVKVYISKRPILGYGYKSGIVFNVWTSTNQSTHNFFLAILFFMGFTGLIIYFSYIRIIYKMNRKYYNIWIVQFLLISLSIMNLLGVVENYGFNVMTFVVLLIISCSNYWVKK